MHIAELLDLRARGDADGWSHGGPSPPHQFPGADTRPALWTRVTASASASATSTRRCGVGGADPAAVGARSRSGTGAGVDPGTPSFAAGYLVRSMRARRVLSP
jgi:hypothetical protein